MRSIPFIILTIFLLANEPALADSWVYRCSFTSYVDAEEQIVKPIENFGFDILVENDDEGKLIGNGGSSNVEIRFGNAGQLNVIEMTPSGNMNTTSLHSDSLKAVHSRHVVIGNKPKWSQYYGRCKPWN